jgi:TRAP transporter TAXI family solute receptor
MEIDAHRPKPPCGQRSDSRRSIATRGGRRQWLIPLFSFILIAFLGIAASRASSPRGLFRIGTGGLTGVYFPIGRLIAEGLTGKGASGIPGIIGVAQNSAGSVENVRAVVAGEIEAGLVQADVAAWAFRGEEVFAGDANARALRAIASLYPEKFQIVTRRDAGIHSVAELRGKRISIDEIGSGTLAVMRIVLAAYGLSEDELRPVYLKPVFTHDKMITGELQGFVMMAGAPMKAVTELSGIGITLVPIAPDKARAINTRYPYLVPGTIPAHVYEGIPATPTLQVHALLVVSAAMSDALAYQVTKALWSDRTRTLLRTHHSQGRAIRLETALDGLSLPLHEGAAKYYRERGMHP